MAKTILLKKKELSPRYIVDISRRLRLKMTPAECMLWEKIAKKQLGGFRFRRQHPIGRYIVDFCCFNRKVVVEIDGDVHNAQKLYDRSRDDVLHARGFKVFRFTNEEVINQNERVLQQILDACMHSEVPRRGI